MNQVHPFINLTAFVLNQIPTGSTFAVNEADSSEQIFIPSQLARSQNILPGDRISVRAIPNRKAGGAKWFAVFVSPIPVTVTPHTAATGAVPTAAPKADWFAAVKAALVKLGGVGTTAEIAEECGNTRSNISTYLRTLHERGEICRAGLRTKEDQARDSWVFWGLTLEDLIPAGMDEVGDDDEGERT